MKSRVEKVRLDMRENMKKLVFKQIGRSFINGRLGGQIVFNVCNAVKESLCE